MAATSSAPAPKVYPPPPFPLLHHHVVIDQFMTPFPFPGPWKVNINAPNIPSGNKDYATLSAFLKGGNLRCNYKVESPSFPKGFYFGLEGAKESNDKKFTINPTVHYRFDKEGENVVVFAPKTGRMSHTWYHNKGTFLTDISTNLYDYLVTDGSVNSRLYPGVLGGFDFVYDPTRSGLKSYTLGLKYKMTHSLSYDSTGAFSFSSIRSLIPGTLQAATHLKASPRKGYEGTVGIAAFSPCGAKMSAKVQMHDGVVAAGVSRIIGGNWRVNVGVHGNIYKKSYGGVGVSFNYDQ